MSRTGPRLPSFCLNRIRPHVRVRSPPVQAKANVNCAAPATVDPNKHGVCGKVEGEKPGFLLGRKIMVVVDSTVESKGALQWALSHTVQCHDTIVLLHVTKPSKQATDTNDESDKNKASSGHEPVSSLKTMCKQKRPEVKVEVAVVEGKEKGPTIVEEAKKQGAALLVLGQKKKSMTWRLIMMWAANRTTGGVVEYCIQNASCMAVAVRRKSKRLGGYLITTKRHKDFWLLA
ncbi:hypothetical protein V6N13_105351 [Hibiscus sabdariffa]|uniref:UspA domain-containing protein n=1 Tax=Hibiscus sabdariffa TaxID=183260 RepID=A0ABR2EWL8_9ROSI